MTISEIHKQLLCVIRGWASAPRLSCFVLWAVLCWEKANAFHSSTVHLLFLEKLALFRNSICTHSSPLKIMLILPFILSLVPFSILYLLLFWSFGSGSHEMLTVTVYKHPSLPLFFIFFGQSNSICNPPWHHFKRNYWLMDNHRVSTLQL